MKTIIFIITLLATNFNQVALASTIDGGLEVQELLTTEDLRIVDEIQSLMKSRRNKLTNKNFGQVEPFLGLPMRYPTFPHQQADSSIGLALLHNGQPIVLFGPNTAMQLGNNLMGFFIQHEYAHHDLGHTRLNPAFVKRTVIEAQADCQAAKNIIGYGLGRIIPEVVQWHASQGCQYDPRTPLENLNISHPCGTQRAQIIKQCSGM